MRPDKQAHVLILGGTTYARELASKLSAYPQIRVTTSFAGRTQNRVAVKGEVRVGGFNGVDGLVDFLRDERIDLLIDATHAFARSISANAYEACKTCSIPRLLLLPPAWESQAGDDWTFVSSHLEAVEKANAADCESVLVAVGRQEIVHYLDLHAKNITARMIELPGCELPSNFKVLQARGPFLLEEEGVLFKSRRIDLLICKNAGGEVGLSKLTAARELGVSVVMLQRPEYKIESQENLALNVADALTKTLVTLNVEGCA